MDTKINKINQESLSNPEELFVLFREERFPVRKFQPRHIYSVLGLLTKGLSDLQIESEFCKAFTQIVCPSFPKEYVIDTSSDLKALDVSEDELNQLLLQVLICHYKQAYLKKVADNAPQEEIAATKKDIDESILAYSFARSGAIQAINSIESIQLSPDEISRLGEEEKRKQIEALQEKLKALQHE